MMYPLGDKEIIDSIPLIMETLFIEEEVEGEEEEGRGRREWLTERQMERPNGGFGRGNGHAVRSQQPVSIERPIPNRQDDEWSSPPPIDERRSDTERHQVELMSFPAAPPPTEERVFMDWSSEGSPRERSVQCIQTAQSVESQRTEPDIRELRGRTGHKTWIK